LNYLIYIIALISSNVCIAYDIPGNSAYKQDTVHLTVQQFHKLTRAVIQQESGGDPDAMSEAGAVGLMQIMPATALEYEKTCAMAHDSLLKPEHNIAVGTCILSLALVRYNGNLVEVLIRYNAGWTWVKKFRDGKKLPDETENYINRVLWWYYND